MHHMHPPIKKTEMKKGKEKEVMREHSSNQRYWSTAAQFLANMGSYFFPILNSNTSHLNL